MRGAAGRARSPRHLECGYIIEKYGLFVIPAVIPAKAGIQSHWTPAFAGVTESCLAPRPYAAGRPPWAEPTPPVSRRSM
jgi:hypothetical protein